jgi:hypothetical protein
MRHTRINPRLGLSSQGGSMSSPRSGITLRPELARSGWLDIMMGKFLRKIGRDKQHEQCKKSVYMGKEEVQERIWFI